MSGIIAQNTLDSSGLIKSPEGGGGAWNFISKTTASNDATVSITSGLDSTYKLYVFTFNNMLPDADGRQLQLDWSTDGGSSYGVTTTSTHFNAEHSESGTAAFHYETARDLAQSDEPVWVANSTGGDSDQSVSGYVYLFDPSNTTFVKHFMFQANSSSDSNVSYHVFGAGYLNTTSAIDALQLNFNGPAGIVSGDICLYGIST